MKTRFILFIMLTIMATSTVMPMAISRLIDQGNEESPDFNADFARAMTASQPSGPEIQNAIIIVPAHGSIPLANPKKRKAPSSDDESTVDEAGLPPLKKQKNTDTESQEIKGLRSTPKGFRMKCPVESCTQIFESKQKFNLLKNVRTHLKNVHHATQEDIQQMIPYLNPAKREALPADAQTIKKYKGGTLYYSDSSKKFHYTCTCGKILTAVDKAALKTNINLHKQTTVHKHFLENQHERQPGTIIFIDNDEH